MAPKKSKKAAKAKRQDAHATSATQGTGIAPGAEPEAPEGRVHATVDPETGEVTLEDDEGGTLLTNERPVGPEDVFRLVYRTLEDLQRVRIAYGHRIRQVIPLLPTAIQPPRSWPSWEAFFKDSAESLVQEEARILKLAEALLKQSEEGRWLLAQHGMGPAIAVSILGEVSKLPGGQSGKAGDRSGPAQLYAFEIGRAHV